MPTAFTRESSEELGKAFRFARHAREMTLREAARDAGISSQYVMNIERGERNVGEPILRKLWATYRLEQVALDNLILRARIMSALQWRGLDEQQARIVWKSIEARLEDVGINIKADMKEELVGALYAG